MKDVRRILSTLGLLALGWISLLLVLGRLSLLDAGIRALAVMVAVLVVGKLIRVGTGILASSLEASGGQGS